MAALADVLAVPPADPFGREVVGVPTRGMERWLTQRLAARLGTSSPSLGDGICAGVDFPSPWRIVADVLAAATGIAPEHDPWVPERLVWPLLEVVTERLEEPWLGPLAGHLASDPTRRYARVRRIAERFDAYGTQRPELPLGWCEGSGTGWQAELWRELRERLDAPSPPERLAGALTLLQTVPERVELPQRLAIFGLTRLPSTHARVLDALALHREVHLFLLHPSPALWDAVGAVTVRLPLRRRADPTAELAGNRLLAAWGRDARELQLQLVGDADAATRTEQLHGASGAEAGSLLAAIQADVRADRAPPGAPLGPEAEDTRRWLAPEDESIRIHACHGRHRQVTVLREAILHRLADDPSLEPRDVIVMCPDVEEFAPLIQAAFGPAEGEEGQLHVRLADRNLRQTNPLLGLTARLLELAAARVTASEVLDLLDAEPVRRRFELTDDDAILLRGWVARAGIHWGIDSGHRRAWKLDGVEAGTWRLGLRRLLLAGAVSPETGELVGPVLPAGEIDSDAIALAGRLAEALERLAAAVAGLAGPATLGDWIDRLETAVDSLGLAATTESWQREELGRVLEGLHRDAGGRAGVRLSLTEARSLIAERLHQRPTRANFRTGRLTVCTLHPMRSVPHRVVCLLGLDDGIFPRRAPRDGDDLLGAEPCVGDRDGRSEDRQMFLDALLAAEDALIITYSGNDERTNAELPPAVPVGELLDAVRATARTTAPADAAPGLAPGDPTAAVLIRHPLQRFDVRNFRPGALGRPGPWSFDATARDGAAALIAGARIAPPNLATVRLAPPGSVAPVSLDELVGFAERPVRAFLRQRLGASVARWEDEVEDGLPVELDGLGRYGVGQRLLEGLLAGSPGPAVLRTEIARGTLPPGELGRPVIDRISPIASAIARRARMSAAGQARTLETNLRLDGERRLSGTVSGVYDRTLLAVSFARLGARHRIATWVRLLALTAAHPEVVWEAVTVGRASDDDVAVATATIPPLGGSEDERRRVALAELDALVAVRSEGLRRPLLAPAATAEAFLSAGAAGLDGAAAATRVWAGSFSVPGERAEPEHELVFGPELDLERLAADATPIWEPLRRRERLEGA